jgi:hypothetical protein
MNFLYGPPKKIKINKKFKKKRKKKKGKERDEAFFLLYPKP